MKLFTILVALAALAVAPAFADGTFLIKYASNLQIGDSFINVTNSGAVQGRNLQQSPLAPAQIDRNGDLCVNIYIFSPDEQEQACCSCLLTPNGLATFSARSLASNTLFGIPLQDIVIKLVATASCLPQAGGGCFPISSAANCNASTAGAVPTFDNVGGGTDIVGSFATGQPLAPGLIAWGTALHANTSAFPSYQVTETHFDRATLSGGELNRITGLCGFIQANGSGRGICPANGLCVPPGPPIPIR